MRSIASLKDQLTEMVPGATFLDAVLVRADSILASRSSLPCARQMRRANAFLCHAIRCIRVSRSAVGCVARPRTGEKTLTQGDVFDVGRVLEATPTLLADGTFATTVALVNAMGRRSTHVVRIKGRIRPYAETLLRYPEFGLSREPAREEVPQW